MSRARILILALVALLAAPGTALGVDTVTIVGTVMRDGLPVAGIDVTVLASGSDLIMSGITDETGAFSIDVEAGIGTELQVAATGPTVVSEPDEEGCSQLETRTGRVTLTLDSLQPTPVVVDLDGVIATTVCTATGTPGELTLPPTDAIGGSDGRSSGSGLGIALAALALLVAGALATTRRRA